MSSFYLYNNVSPKVVYSVYPAALFGAISAVFSGKHPAINKGRKRYIYFQEKIHIMSHRESFIIPYISPPRYALWEILDCRFFFCVSSLLKYSGLEHFSPELSSEDKQQTRKHLNIDGKKTKVSTESIKSNRKKENIKTLFSSSLCTVFFALW